jgi:hypothetical protein
VLVVVARINRAGSAAGAAVGSGTAVAAGVGAAAGVQAAKSRAAKMKKLNSLYRLVAFIFTSFKQIFLSAKLR